MRKVRSYEVEVAFYRSYGSRCAGAPRIAEPLGHAESNGERLLILEDLDDAGFVRRSRRPRGPDLDRKLTAATFRTFVHGDAKPANFCFGPVDAAALEHEWRSLYPVAVADFERFLHGWR